MLVDWTENKLITLIASFWNNITVVLIFVIIIFYTIHNQKMSIMHTDSGSRYTFKDYVWIHITTNC